MVLLVVFSKPIGFIVKTLIKGALYSALMFVLNFITSVAGLSAGINLISGLTCGFLGIYGVIISYFAGLLYSFRL